MSIYIKDPLQQAEGCIIWMHGLGADASDMSALAAELNLQTPLRHVFLDAPIRPVTLNNHMPMRAWYDIKGMTLTDREDSVGIKASQTLIHEVIMQQQSEGFSSEHIMLAGFSQGAAMALFSGLSMENHLGGLIVLSGYLPLASEVKPMLPRETPIFVALGEDDPMVRPAWTAQCVDHLQAAGYSQISLHRYPMDHAICIEEVRDLERWIDKCFINREFV